jgi:proton-dependent oligopeptide transporter, POT family
MTKDPTTEFAPEAAGPEAAAAAGDHGTWFGHPRGLSTLFFTELWERFSYYGMRGILILYMAAAVAEGGLGFSDGTSAAIYGMYTGFVYLLALPGGWVADTLWGQRKAVFVGGCIIAAGHFSMALPALGMPELPFFFLGLALIVTGTGLLKPNVSTIVGELYPEGGARRDAGFSVFYMGINVGAFAGPLVCGWLGENVNWHWGFSAAGFGMVLGLIQYKLGARYLGRAGLLSSGDSPATVARKSRNFYLAFAAVAGLGVLLVGLAVGGVIAVDLQAVATWLGFLILLLVIVFFAYLILGTGWAAGFVVLFGAAVAFFLGGYEPEVAGRFAIAATLGVFILVNLGLLAARRSGVTMEKRRLMVIFWIFLLAALFWAGFEQAGSSMNLFAERETDRIFGPYGWMGMPVVVVLVAVLAALLGWAGWKLFRRRDLFTTEKAIAALVLAGILAFCAWIVWTLRDGWEMPASWLQSINPLFIITLAPVFGTLWIWLARRNANPSIPVKFGLGLLGLAAGFFVLAWGAANTGTGTLVAPAWLVVTYFLHTCGELCLSPVGLSSITKLAPPGRVGQMMGVWFIASALGNLIAGLVAGQLENLESQALFWQVAMFVGVGGLVALLLAPFVRRLMGHVE